MFRNCLASALRHLARNRLHTLISVFGLAIGLCTALLATLVIRNQYSYDHFVPGFERTYVVLTVFSPPGMAPQYRALTDLRLAAQLRERFSQVEATGRMLDGSHRIQYGEQASRETVYWADPDITSALPMAAYAGDVAAALRTADGVVLSRSHARRFFGSDDPLGMTLTIDGHPMAVRALIEDPPPNGTHQPRHIIAAGIASFSPTTRREADLANRGPEYFAVMSGLTYVRLKPGSDAESFESALPTLSNPPPGTPAMSSLELIRIDRFNAHEGVHPGFASRMRVLAMLGAIVLLIAGLNFVNLQTARSALRAREVAIRKVAGAPRGLLIVQFLGEALIYAAAATLLALAMAEWLLPRVNAFLDAGARLDYIGEPGPVALLLGISLLFGLLAGAWPAFVQSGFRPLTTLRGAGGTAGDGALRRGLVVLQFALLIVLAICAGVVHRQREFALHEALRIDGEQVLMVYAPPRTPQDAAFADELRKLPGVRALTRASLPFLGSTGHERLGGISFGTVQSRTGESVSVSVIGVDLDLFGFYGIQPLAGRLPASGEPSRPVAETGYLVINETASRKFDLGTPAEALEQALPITPESSDSPDAPVSSRVLAVVPDFSLSPIWEAVHPTVYYQPASGPELLNIRLAGSGIPETLAAIDALWKRIGHEEPPLRFFLDQQQQRQYLGMLRQSQAFGICALIAMLLSCVGLFSLTAAATERRTREIGVRKALGADTPDVLRLLLWQFSRPVLWANLIAWPAAALLMQRWLQGFAYRIDLPLWLFPAASATAVILALLAISLHCLRVARAKPVEALRHE